MKKILLFASAFLVLAGGIGFFATRSTQGSSPVAGSGVFTTEIPAPLPIGSASPAPAADVAQELVGASRTSEADKAVAFAASPGSGGSGEMVANDVATFGPPVGGVGPKVIKTADLTVQVEKGNFSDAFDRATLVAQKYGGFVMSSSTSGEKVRYGNLLIRVPSKNFDLAMSDLRHLGDAKSESVNGQEVTDQFIDLNARLRTWQAQENVLLKLMDDANSIAETMTVQRELQQVQYQIEQIKGQLRVLRDQTSFATIALSMHEPGAVTKPKPHQPSLSEAWSKAMAGFLGVVSMVIVGLGYLVPLSLLAGALWLAVRRLRSRAVPPTPAT